NRCEYILKLRLKHTGTQIYFVYRLTGPMEVTSVVNNGASLVCNVSTRTEDEIQLVFWYKNSNATGPPIYTLDIRDTNPIHFISEPLKNRAMFNFSVRPPLLIISPVKQSDSGYYSCRADYKWSRTQSSTVKLNVIVTEHITYFVYCAMRWS
ncbi:lachesin-like protein, partial [Leptotrombidium deliense]